MSQIYAPGSIAGPPAAFMGPYNSGTTYTVGQAVSSAGSSYVSLVAGNVGNAPATSPTQWSTLAVAGAPGTNGVNGTPGTNGANGTNGATGAPGAPGTNGQVTNAALVAAVGLMDRTSDAGVNQLNVATNVSGLINGDGTVGANASYVTSGFIRATGSLMITNFNLVGNGRPACCYDINQAFLGVATTVGGGAFSLPDPTTPGMIIQLLAGTAYVRFTGFIGHPGAADMVVFGDATHAPVMPGGYVGFSRVTSSLVDSKIATAVAGLGTTAGPQITASLPHGRNLYDTTLRSDGFYINGGTLLGGGTYTPLSTTGFMLVAGLGTIYCNGIVVNQGQGQGSVSFSDANQTYIGSAGGEVTLSGLGSTGFMPNTAITIPAGAVYARMTVQFSGGDGTLAPLFVAPAALMVMATTTGSTYQPFGYTLPTAIDSKIATAVAAANAAIQTQIAALGGGLGAIRENRPAQVAIFEGGSVAANGSQTLFSATGGPGSVERIQLAFVNTAPTAAKLTEMEACTLTITVDGTVFTTTVGMFFLNIGISDANPANETFSTKWLERSLCANEAQQGVGRRIYIPYQSSCSIVFKAVTAPMAIYTQVEYFKGAPLPGLHSPNRKVFHMATTEWRDSAGLTPYQQIQLLATAVAGPGVLEHWHIAGSCDARSISNAPGWLEANPSITFDGTSFSSGGTEDFFGTQYYGMGLQPKANDFSFSLFTSAKTNLTYTLLARHFDQYPIPFTTSLGPVIWSNGQAGEGATPLPNLKCGMQIVWYTAT